MALKKILGLRCLVKRAPGLQEFLCKKKKKIENMHQEPLKLETDISK